MHRLQRTQRIPKPINEVFEFFADASNLEAITPPFLKFRILTPLPIEMKEGARIEYALSLFGVPIRWKTLISTWEEGVQFVDEQTSGPYSLWIHRHTFKADGDETVMEDTVDYKEPFGPLGQIAHLLFVRYTLKQIFDYRARIIEKLLCEPTK